MVNRRQMCMWTGLAACVAVMFVSLRSIAFAGDQVATDTNDTNSELSGPTVSPSPSLLAYQSRVTQEAEKASALLVAKLEEVKSRAAQVNLATPSTWPGDFDRIDFNLAEYCFVSMGKLDPKLLLRHPRLNPSDQPVAIGIVDDFRLLIKAINDAQLPIAESYLELYREEAVAQIEAGGIKPREGPRISESTLNHLARIQHKEGKFPGKSLDEVKELLRASAISINVDGIVHRGEVYPADHFTDMPLTDAAFLTKHYIAMDTASGLALWCDTYGLTKSQIASVDIEEFATRSRLDLAKRGPGLR